MASGAASARRFFTNSKGAKQKMASGAAPARFSTRSSGFEEPRSSGQSSSPGFYEPADLRRAARLVSRPSTLILAATML